MVKLLRLVTGEVLLGDVTEHDDGNVSVDKPCALQLQMMPSERSGEPGKMAVGMFPYQPWVDEALVFWPAALLGPATAVDKNTRDGYNERFNPSAIIQPSNSGLLLG